MADSDQRILEKALVRLITTDGRVMGSGFLVGRKHVLTCAHVVSMALGLTAYPEQAPQDEISLDFPFLHTPKLRARVVLWKPLQKLVASTWEGDIAGLELLDSPPPGAQWLGLTPLDDMWGHEFKACGFTPDNPEGLWASGRSLAEQSTGWLQIEGAQSIGIFVQPGFSGTPIWDIKAGGVTGMVVSRYQTEAVRTAFAISAEKLLNSWPGVLAKQAPRVQIPSVAPGAPLRQPERQVDSKTLLVHEKMFDMDFTNHTDTFRQSQQSGKMLAYVIQGPLEYGHQWLLHFLLYMVYLEEKKVLRHIFDMNNRSLRKSTEVVWQTLASEYLGGSPYQSREETASQLAVQIQSQCVILEFQNVDYMDPSGVKELVDDFWKPLAVSVLEKLNNKPARPLWMIMTHYNEHNKAWPQELSEDLAQTPASRRLKLLPMLCCFDDVDIKSCLKTVSYLLPVGTDRQAKTVEILQVSQNGAPELVARQICNLCGVEHKGEDVWKEIPIPTSQTTN